MQGFNSHRGILTGAFGSILISGLLLACIATAEVPIGRQEGSAPSATDSLSPIKLPRTEPAPATLTTEFSSPPVEGSTRILHRIDLELSPRLTFEVRGLKSCDEETLYTPSVDARTACAGSLVGHGTVTSEIYAQRLEQKITATGHMLAFYSNFEGRPLIYAQVIIPEPVGLLYVIPFTIAKHDSLGGTNLFVPAGRMSGLQGICVSKRPDCFEPPYDLENFYSRISGMDLILHRVYRSEGERRSFISATCAAPKEVAFDTYTLLKTKLTYTEGGSSTMADRERCRPSS